MYEFSVTQTVNNAILNLCEQAGWDKVKKILVKVGGIRKVNPELMSFIFTVLSEGTPTEGATFSVMCLPVALKCKACGRKGYRDDGEIICPSCGSKDVKILSGSEISIESLEVEKNH